MRRIKIKFEGYLTEDKKEELYRLIDDFKFSYCFDCETTFKTKIICRRIYKNSLFPDKYLVRVVFCADVQEMPNSYYAYDDDVYFLIRGLGVCLSLANPKIGFELRKVVGYLDDELIFDELIFQSEIVFHIMEMYELNYSIKMETVYNWIKNNSPYFIYGNIAPIYLSAYTHAIEQDNDDALIYSTIGLENIF